MKRTINELCGERDDETLRKLFGDAETFHANFYHAFMSEEDLAKLRPLVRGFVTRLLQIAT